MRKTSRLGGSRTIPKSRSLKKSKTKMTLISKPRRLKIN